MEILASRTGVVNGYGAEVEQPPWDQVVIAYSKLRMACDVAVREIGEKNQKRSSENNQPLDPLPPACPAFRGNVVCFP